MSDDMFEITPERIEASNMLSEALSDVPPEDALFALAMASAAFLKQFAPGAGEEDTVFEGFINMIWRQLNEEGPPQIQ